ncbi:DUF4865 family protein [Actinomycetota bacterium Odt1-20B]
MHAMQYEITLPADYDMDIIRERVATKGHLLDDFPGLGVKAYLMRERGVDGSPVNAYAPLYLWNTPQGMNSFLWGPGFQGIVDDFGRPEVQHWTGLAYEEGVAAGAPAKAAVRRRQRIPQGAQLSPLMEELALEAGRLARRDGVILAATAVDPRTWEALHFSLWAHDAPEGVGDVFQVRHVSAPERKLLTQGRHW